MELPRERVYDLSTARHPKFRVKSVHELSAVVYDLSTTITAFKSWIAWERSLRFKYSATAFVESAVNQVLSKRFVKRQQMRWTERGAHLLLQVRTRVLNEDWRSTLSRWYPGIEETCDAKAA